MSEEQAQALMQQLQAMESYLTDLVQREETVMRLLQEAASAVESMKGMTGNIGAGASVEQDKNSAINYMESRIKELEMVLQQLASQRQEVSMKLEQGQHEMNKLIQSNRNQMQ